MLDLAKATICYSQDFCTSCPFRKGCANRINFYNEEVFLKSLNMSTSLASSMLLEFGFPKSVVIHSDAIFAEQMKQKRNRELEEHPIYSAE